MRRCGAADKPENRELISGAYLRGAPEDEMDTRRGYYYVIDFNPPIRTKPKLRPALVPQTPGRSNWLSSTIAIPTTSRVIKTPGLLRLHIPSGVAGLDRDSDLLLGQLIAIANDSFRHQIRVVPDNLMEEVERRVRTILSL